MFPLCRQVGNTSRSSIDRGRQTACKARISLAFPSPSFVLSCNDYFTSSKQYLLSLGFVCFHFVQVSFHPSFFHTCARTDSGNCSGWLRYSLLACPFVQVTHRTGILWNVLSSRILIYTQVKQIKSNAVNQSQNYFNIFA